MEGSGKEDFDVSGPVVPVNDLDEKTRAGLTGMKALVELMEKNRIDGTSHTLSMLTVLVHDGGRCIPSAYSSIILSRCGVSLLHLSCADALSISIIFSDRPSRRGSRR